MVTVHLLMQRNKQGNGLDVNLIASKVYVNTLATVLEFCIELLYFCKDIFCDFIT